MYNLKKFKLFNKIKFLFQNWIKIVSFYYNCSIYSTNFMCFYRVWGKINYSFATKRLHAQISSTTAVFFLQMWSQTLFFISPYLLITVAKYPCVEFFCSAADAPDVNGSLHASIWIVMKKTNIIKTIMKNVFKKFNVLEKIIIHQKI